jgi:glycosyltransferase involved in cell wall biosynthesis
MEMSKMKVALLTKANSWHAPLWLEYLVGKGHRVSYIGIPPGGEAQIPKGVEYFEINLRSSNKLIQTIETIFKVRRLTREMEIDIIHILGMRYAFCLPFVKSKKKVIESCGCDILNWPKKYFVIRFVYKFLYKFVDGVIQDYKLIQELAIKYGAPTKHNEVIEFGIDFDIFNLNIETQIARKRLNIEDEKMVFSPRGLEKVYSIDTIIKSILIVRRTFPNVRYVFCNHLGNSGREYKQLARELQVNENIIFTGFLDNKKDMPCFYASADVVVSVPLSDSCPRSVCEAMACGTPVIISELPWYHNKFRKNHDLITIPVEDEEALAKAILLILVDEKIIDLQSAYNKVKQNMDMNILSHKMEIFYCKLLSGNTQ